MGNGSSVERIQFDLSNTVVALVEYREKNKYSGRLGEVFLNADPNIPPTFTLPIKFGDFNAAYVAITANKRPIKIIKLKNELFKHLFDGQSASGVIVMPYDEPYDNSINSQIQAAFFFYYTQSNSGVLHNLYVNQDDSNTKLYNINYHKFNAATQATFYYCRLTSTAQGTETKLDITQVSNIPLINWDNVELNITDDSSQEYPMQIDGIFNFTNITINCTRTTPITVFKMSPRSKLNSTVDTQLNIITINHTNNITLFDFEKPYVNCTEFYNCTINITGTDDIIMFKDSSIINKLNPKVNTFESDTFFLLDSCTFTNIPKNQIKLIISNNNNYSVTTSSMYGFDILDSFNQNQIVNPIVDLVENCTYKTTMSTYIIGLNITSDYTVDPCNGSIYYVNATKGNIIITLPKNDVLLEGINLTFKRKDNTDNIVLIKGKSIEGKSSKKLKTGRCGIMRLNYNDGVYYFI
jgi:hypothetical protein